MKRSIWSSLSLLVSAATSGSAEIVYSGLLDIPIPANFSGVHIDLTGDGDWDINPFFGGLAVANSGTFQPARTGTGAGDPLVSFVSGERVGPEALFATGFGGSDAHLGSTFSAGEEGYFGFTFGGNYGWARVIFTENAPGGLVRDWAFHRAGGSIAVGGVEERVVLPGARETVVHASAGEEQVLVSPVQDRAGDTGSLRKTGQGTLTLTGAHPFSGATILDGGTLTLLGGAAFLNTPSIQLGTGTTLDVLALDALFVGLAQSLDGAGTILGNVTVSGKVFPGGDVGTLLHIDGDFRLEPEGRWFVGIGGAAPVEYDRLLVTGAVDISGEIVVILRDGYSPMAGDTFQLATFGTLIGAEVNFRFDDAVLSEGLEWSHSDFGLTGTIAVIPEPQAIVHLICVLILGAGYRRRARNRSVASAGA
jgi:autotransporter-associated beta strand protein